MLHLTHLAAAIAVYKAESGAYPGRLEELVPGVLKKLPVDLYYAKPFIYKRTEDGYLLYSAGENGNDDGGSNESLKIFEGRSLDELGGAETPDRNEKTLSGADDVAIRVPRPPWQFPMQ